MFLNKKKLHNYFRSRFNLKPSTKGWYRFSDPDDNHKDLSMGVNFSYGIVKNFRGDYKDFCLNYVKEIEQCSFREALDLIEGYNEVNFIVKPINVRAAECQYPEHFKSLYSDGNMAKRARNYLKERGFNTETLHSLGFGYCDDGDYKNYIIIPFYVDGRLRYYIGRTFINNKLKYRNPESELVGVGKSELFFNEDALSLNDTIALTEGWTDAMTWGENGIASLGWKLSDIQKSKIIKANLKKLIIVADKGFYKEACMTAFDLYSYVKVIHVVNLDSFDDKKDLNEIGKRAVEKQLRNTDKFHPSMIFDFE